MKYIVSLLLIASCFIIKPLEEAIQPFIIVERTACYGTCPQYIISIYDHGKITYHGKRFVDRIGFFVSSISSNIIDDIKILIDQSDFFSLDSMYLAPMTDVPSVITTISLNKQKHTIVDEFKAPLKLKKIYYLVDSIANSVVDWEPAKLLKQ